MGNKTNDRNWAAMERLRFIETCAWWKGVVQRQDLAGLFGVSMAQASSDLQRYLEMNPGAFVYNLRQKRYEATAEMKCVTTRPRLDEAVARFLGGDARSTWTGWTDESEGGGCVAVLKTPVRTPPSMGTISLARVYCPCEKPPCPPIIHRNRLASVYSWLY